MPKQIDIAHALGVLRRFFRERKRPPSYEEVRRLFHYRSKNAAFWLIRKLRNEGFLLRDSQGKLILESPGGARLLGTVQAGFPSPAEEELADTMNLDEYLVPHPDRSYLIKVTGDSMVDAGICEGDLVIVERGREPCNKDIVIAQVDGDWTMKFYEKSSRGIALIPANKKYPPLRPKEELVIGGVVVGVVRKYK